MHRDPDFLIVGSGVAGAFLARELARAGAVVTVVERGRRHTRLGTWTGALTIYTGRGHRTTPEGVVIDAAHAVGGTAVVSCGNAAQVSSERLLAHGIAVEPEYASIAAELGVVAKNTLEQTRQMPTKTAIFFISLALPFTLILYNTDVLMSG